ncbi:polysaccharide lyase family 8 super-sandwich domain-containing protein [Neobacillus niacini]|uniref:polysaccharide lyase family 8 super-sandwich domain-containing protein n=1 Tax=Neobacillus niacini TaxID=86668 RepID=UPI0039838DB6
MLILSMVPPATASTPEDTSGKVHVYTSFESSANVKDQDLYSSGTVTITGDIGGNWGGYNSEGVNNFYRMEQAPGREDYSLKFVTTANATKHLNIGRSNLGASGITGKLVFEASVYLNDRNLERRFQLRSLNTPDSTATTNKDVIIFATNGNILDVNRNVIGQYQPNTWQNFKIFIDNSTKVLTYFVNGQYLAAANITEDWSNVRTLYVYQFKSTNNVPGEMYVDDIMLSDFLPVTGVSADSGSLEITETLSKQLNVSVLPMGASDTRLQFSSSDENVVTVTNGGLVTGINEGAAKVTVTSVEGNFSEVIQVKVNAYVPLESINLPERITLPATTSVQLEPQFMPSNATKKDLIWRSSDDSIASVTKDGFVVAGEKLGEVRIYATSVENNELENSTIIEVIPNIPVTNIHLVTPVQVHKYDKIQLEYKIEPEEASNQNVIWASDHPDIISVDQQGMITGIKEGTARLTVKTEDGGFEAHADIEVLPPNVKSIELPKEVIVYTNDTVTLSPRFIPHDASTNVSWKSDDENIAAITAGGVITGVRTGATTVRAVTEDGKLEAAATVVVKNQDAADEYDVIRKRWAESQVGNESLDYNNVTVKQRNQSLTDSALKYWKDLNINNDKEYLWSDLKPSLSDSAILNENYTRLRVLAQAFANKGSSLYHNMLLKDDILGALEWLTENHYTNDGSIYGNWWNWEIGIPTRLTDILILMYDYTPSEQIVENVLSMDHYVGDIRSEEFRHVGANRSDIMLAQIKIGVLEKSNHRLLNARDGLTPLFAYTTSGDGFYEDGSFIQHNTIAYTGSYGEVLIQGLGNILFLLNGTAFEPVDPSIENVYRWIEEAYAPILYKGQVLDMTRGRAIVRENMDAYYSARNILIGISRIAVNAPREKALYLKGLVKNHFTYQLQRGLNYYDLPLDLASIVQEWAKDASITPVTETPSHFSFNSMARTVHRGYDYLFGISKSSKRIATYELTNGQNPKGWYTGDGMTYLYTNDLGQYTDNFWATVNWHRLPGTTVVQRERFSSEYQHGDAETTPENSYAGGSKLGDIGIAGMNLKQIGTAMSANKSWFMFKDVIVALGSGINSTDHKPVETIVEQRKLLKDNSNELTIDGELKTGMFSEETIENPHWIHLEGNAVNSGIGYVFLDDQPMKIERAEQEGRWSDITVNMPQTELVKENYVTMSFDHGTNPTNANYEYVLLPNATKESTEKFAAKPSIQILENSTDVHAVRDKQAKITGLNFWKDEPVQVSWNEDDRKRSITSNQKASVITREMNGVMEIAVSDPTLENNGTIEIEMDNETDYLDLIQKDSEVEILQLSPTLKIRTNVAHSFGKTFTISLQIEHEAGEPGEGGEDGGDTEKPGKGNNKPGKGHNKPGKGDKKTGKDNKKNGKGKDKPDKGDKVKIQQSHTADSELPDTA